MKRIRFHPPRRLVRIIFLIELVVFLIYSIAILIVYLRAQAENALFANSYYAGTVEYILATLALTLITPLVIELVEQSTRSDK